jgi:hypothetical protein
VIRCWRSVAATLAYLEQRHITLEREIVDALHHHPADHFAVADLKYRKSIIADEIQHIRRLIASDVEPQAKSRPCLVSERDLICPPTLNTKRRN